MKDAVAVTGATGHIGANLVRALLAQGRPVRALVRRDLRALAGLNAEHIEGDVLNPESLARLFKGAGTVFHLAARISIIGDEGGLVEKINVEGTRNVVEACLRCGVRRLVHFSSIHAFSSGFEDEEITESRARAFDDRSAAYDRTKAAGEMVIGEAIKRGLDAVIVNPTAVIGPYDFKPSRMGEVLLGLFRRRFSLLVDGGYNWVDVRDVVSGALAAEKLGRCGESYLLAGRWAHFRELSALAGNAAGRRVRCFIIPMKLAVFAAPAAEFMAKATGRTPKFTPEAIRVLQGHRHVSHRKAADELEYAPRLLEDTVRDTFAWFRDAGLV